MICKNCGATIEENALFCDNCGMPQDYLIKQVISGDQHAFELLYNYSYQNVYWTIHSMANLDEDTIYDIMQNSYLKAFRALPQLKEPTAFNGWIKRIAQNETLDYLRKSSKDNPIFFSDMTSDDSDVEEYDVKDEAIESNPEASMEYQDRSRLLNEILDELPSEQRVVLSMYYMQDMSVKEIAEELGINEHTVKSRMSYGRKKVEKSVLDLEKKGVSLLGLTAMGFFTWLLTGISSDAKEAIPAAVLQGVERSIPKASKAVQNGDINEGKTLEKNNDTVAGTASKAVREGTVKTAVKTAGISSATKILIGAVVVAVLGVGIGIGVYQASHRNIVEEEAEPLENPPEEIAFSTEKESETSFETEMTESETETPMQEIESFVVETEMETEQETETEQEMVTEQETETEQKTETETETAASLTDDTMILNSIQSLGYEYIGGQTYDVLYQGGYIGSENAGMDQDPPVGVASYEVADLDGDGEDELLLVILEATDRVYDTSGKQDSRLAFVVCENRDGAWEEAQHISQVSVFGDDYQIDIMSIADVLPCISTYLVPTSDGMKIVINNPFYGSFPMDFFAEVIEISYSPAGLIGTMYGSESVWTDEESAKVNSLNQEMQSPDSILISKIFLPDFYNDADELNWDEFSYLQMGQDVATTLVIDDFKDLNEIETSNTEENPTENESKQKSAEQEGDKIVEENGLLIIYKDDEQAESESPEISEEAKAAYQVILDEYIAASNDNVGDEEIFAQDYIEEEYPDVASRVMFYYSPGSGTIFFYTYYDIDGNGQEELLIGCGYALDDDYSEMMEYIDLVDVYTFDGEKAVKFTENANTLGDRSQLYIYENGAMVIRDSGGAANGDYRFMKISDDGYTVRLDKEYVYTTEMGEPFTYSSDDETLSEEEFTEFVSEYIEEPMDFLMSDDGYFQYDNLTVKNYNWIQFIN